jgi:hypothetical protein
MGINNNFFDCVLAWYCWLNVIALVLGCFRSDAKKVFKDLSNFIRLNKWYISIGVFMVIFTMSPFTIPYTIKNICNRFKGEK